MSLRQGDLTRRVRRGGVCTFGVAVAVGAVLLMLSTLAWADRIELANGKTYEGLVVQQSAASVTFKVYTARGGKMTRTWPMRQVADLVVDGKEPVFQAPSKPSLGTAASASASAAGDVSKRTPAEVFALIDAAGRSRPDWWASVKLTYPDTLDLTVNQKVKRWAPSVNLGAYVWAKVNQQPGNWRNGVKLLHRVVEVRKNDPKGREQAMEMLAHAYFRLLNDYPRAAYWYQKIVQPRRRVQALSVVNLSACYWKLGSRSLAVKTMQRFGMDGKRPYPVAIKLWLEMGDVTRARAMADVLIKTPRQADLGHLAAGHVCRYVGEFDQAAAHYEKLLALKQGSRRLQLNQKRARASLAAVKILKTLDLTVVADGTYTGQAVGYRGPVGVEVTVAGGRITRVEVVQTKEDLFYTNMTDVPAQIVERQSLHRIDGITGATTTSDAIMSAAAKALGSALSAD